MNPPHSGVVPFAALSFSEVSSQPSARRSLTSLLLKFYGFEQHDELGRSSGPVHRFNLCPAVEDTAPVARAAESDLLIVDLQHLVLELRHDVANAEAATKLAQEATERLREQRRQGIADIRELLKRFEQR